MRIKGQCEITLALFLPKKTNVSTLFLCKIMKKSYENRYTKEIVKEGACYNKAIKQKKHSRRRSIKINSPEV